MLESVKPLYRKLRSDKNRFIYKINNIYLANAQAIFSKKKKFVPESGDLIECFQLPKNILDKVIKHIVITKYASYVNLYTLVSHREFCG